MKWQLVMNKLIFIIYLVFAFSNLSFAEDSCVDLDDCLQQVIKINLTSNGCDGKNKSGDKTEKKFKLGNSKYIIGGALMAPAALIGGTAIHELSHAAVINHYGFTIQEIRVFP